MAKRYDYALCVENRGYSAALIVRKVYQVIPDATAEESDLLRVVDESGEDYLYPARYFVPLELPRGARRAFTRKSA